MTTSTQTESLKPSASTVHTPALAPRRAWIILAVVLLFSIAAPLNQYKVPPILPVLMDAFRLSVGSVGILMSVYALTGLILAIPAGFVFQRVGFRVTGIIAGGAVVAGAALGAMSTSVGGLLASRVLEGVGTSFVAVLAPAIIALWFPPARRGTAMGMWAIWVPVGSWTMFAVAPAVSQAGGWRAVWWLGCAFALVALVLYLAIVRAPSKASASTSRDGGTDVALPSWRRLLVNRDIWLLSLTFGFMNMGTMAVGTYSATYLNLERSFTLAQASMLTSVISLVVIGSSPLGGFISDRLGSRKKPYLVGLAAMACLAPLFVYVDRSLLLPLVIMQGLVAGLVPTNVFSAGVGIAGDERLGGLAMGVLMVGQNAGMLLGPLVFGALAESTGGWPLAFGSVLIMYVCGAVAGSFARVR